MLPLPPASTAEGSESFAPSTGAIVASSKVGWICPICQHVANLDATTRSAPSNGAPTPSLASSFAYKCRECGVCSSYADGHVVCPYCTLHNPPMRTQCEACQLVLPVPTEALQRLPPSFPNHAPLGARQGLHADDLDVPTNGDFVRVVFRGGGMTNVQTKLQDALKQHAWRKQLVSVQPSPGAPAPTSSTSPLIPSPSSVGGITGILRAVDVSQTQQKETLTDAFQDLDALMAKAGEMVHLAELITTKLSNTAATGDATDAAEGVQFQSMVLQLGIANPVTKDTAGNAYHNELARELAAFLDPILLPKYGGILSLTDLYCIFNRARGVALISPADLTQACRLLEPLKLPLRLRKLDSGLMLVQSETFREDAVIARVLQYLEKRGGSLSALELAELESISLALAQEQLEIAEQRGSVCRDESVEGVRFYDNLLVKFILE